MKTNSKAEQIALNPKCVRKPILYWQASNGMVNNSIALLRWKYGNTVTYKAIR